ncbi:MAG: sigma-70 family RNA polymerase sigma factor [Planctomycetota bacterium]|nr:sigma-70 family RNA polymerase sigma factor [Planctomycetota bacterium]
MDEWDELTHRHGPSVWRTICRLLGAADGADDPFQQTFLEYFELSRRRTIDRPHALLTRIATRRAIDVIRQRAAARARMTALPDDIAAPSAGPLKAMAGRETLDLLRGAIADLPEQESAVFCLAQLEQMESTDVARVLNLTPNHVAVLLHRARKRLQARLTRSDRIDAKVSHE